MYSVCGWVMLELNEYQNKGLVWYGFSSHNDVKRIATTFPTLDKALQGGFPEQGIIEIKSMLGIGELRLVTPYLSGRQRAGKVVLIAPPMQINAEFLVANAIDPSNVLLLTTYEQNEALWAAEQCLSSGCCSAVVLWQEQLSIKQSRRLMLASEQGGSTVLLIRYQTPNQPLLSLPSTVSLSLKPHHQGVQVKVDKQKGGRITDFFVVSMNKRWPELSNIHSRCRDDGNSNLNSNVLPFSQVVAQ